MVDLLYLIYLFRHLVTPPYYLRRLWKLPRGAYSSRWNRVNRRLKFPFCNCNSGVLEGIKLWCGTKSNPSSKSYKTTKKWLAKCPQALPYSNTPVIHFEFFYRRESGNYRFQIEHQKVGFLGRKIVWIFSDFCLSSRTSKNFWRSIFFNILKN